MTANRTTTLFVTPCRGVTGGVIEDPPDQPDEEPPVQFDVPDKAGDEQRFIIDRHRTLFIRLIRILSFYE